MKKIIVIIVNAVIIAAMLIFVVFWLNHIFCVMQGSGHRFVD